MGSGAVTRSAKPHPLTGQPFPSPVPPGTGWPGDPARPRTPRAQTPEDVVRLASSARALQVLDARESVCRACPRLVAWREEVAVTGRRAFAEQPYWGRPVPGWGDPSAPVLVVGLAPAAHGGNRTGRIFTGDRSGDWIFAALWRAGFANQPTSVAAGDGLALTGVRIAAPVRCAPPDNHPLPSERDTCAPWLDREVALLPDLRVVLALGGFAWDSALAMARRSGWRVPRPKPRFGHGAESVLVQPDGGEVRLLGCFHVSQQNMFTGRLTEAMLDDVLARARRLAGLPPVA
ncbi:MAG: uracil-DNA glycosylase [Actinomycetes bacterium]